MSADALALATSRARTWALLGRLFVEGPTDAVRAWVEAIPPLAEALHSTAPETWSATHQRVFGNDVFPYESVFASEDGLLGGPSRDRVEASLRAVGFHATVPGAETDHVGVLCLAMAHLCEAEAQALEDGADVVEALRQHQRDVLSGHLLAWLPPLVVAIGRQGDAFSTTVAELALELAASHGVEADVTLAPPIDVLEDDKAGLARVARALLVPARAGWFLSRSDLARIGRSVGLPHGFGPRWKMLESMLVTGVDHGRARDALGALEQEARAWDEKLASYGALGVPVAAWRARVEATLGVLARLKAAAV